MLALSTVGAVSTRSLAQAPRAPGRDTAALAHTRVLMLGDSQMLTLMYFGSTAFVTSGPRYESDAIVGCGVFDPGMQAAGACAARARTWQAAIRHFDPDLSVLLIGAWEALDFRAAGHTYVHGTAAHQRALVPIVEHAIRALTRRGGRVALLEVPPFGRTRGDTTYGPERDEPASVAGVNRALRTVARADPDQVTFVPWADAIAPGGRYTATVDGVDARPDGVHFASEAGTQLVSDRLVPILRALALRAHAARSGA